jgi:hypothetical protein
LKTTMIYSAVSVATKPSVETVHEEEEEKSRPVIINRSQEVRQLMEAQLERLRLKDKLSRRVSEEVRFFGVDGARMYRSIALAVD